MRRQNARSRIIFMQLEVTRLASPRGLLVLSMHGSSRRRLGPFGNNCEAARSAGRSQPAAERTRRAKSLGRLRFSTVSAEGLPAEAGMRQSEAGARAAL
jgi:hypothetical protein